MESHEDAEDLRSVVSGLSSLENDAADDFERLMIQNARDERRLNEALNGRVHAFRKGRAPSHVALTIDNLEKNNLGDERSWRQDAHVAFDGPPSSSGSTRSDPAIHVPPSWGRKSRSNRNWMRTITSEAPGRRPQTPTHADDTLERQYIDPYIQTNNEEHNADMPRRSIEESPLSHKSSVHGTPRNDRSGEWDLTFELNEASMIASTPYIPRNTALDDIRQREIESLREQKVTAAQLDRIRDVSPEANRYTRAPPEEDTIIANGDVNTAPLQEQRTTPEKRVRTRTNSWKAIGKSQPVTGTGKENPLDVAYKSAEKNATAENSVTATTPKSPAIRIGHRREDSQDLLRRLARASHTPSPRRTAPTQDHITRKSPLQSSTADVADEPPVQHSLRETHVASVAQETQDKTPPTDGATKISGKVAVSRKLLEPIAALSESEAGPSTRNANATPNPVDRSVLNPKTPIVTGAWIDTPGPRTATKSFLAARSPSKKPAVGVSPKKDKGKAPARSIKDEPAEGVIIEPIRPSVPSSALHKLIQEAKGTGADYGDSTINSLEELITPLSEGAEGAIDEDTLQGLQLPTSSPRNEAERQRQQELVHLHRMNDRLRAVRSNIRDASRGMKRVEDHVDERDDSGDRVKIVNRACPCAEGHAHEFSLWRWWRSIFWSRDLKLDRQSSNSQSKAFGGFTVWGILTLLFFTWWISEEIACELYCHPVYAAYSPYPYSVNMDAPEYPIVIPTLIYRGLIRDWWSPLSAVLSWTWIFFGKLVFGADTFSEPSRSGSVSTSTAIWSSNIPVSTVVEDFEWDMRMGDDQLVR